MNKFLLILLMALTLASCGVRGDPEAPTQLQQSQ
jgi:predicted small lipoprotein YifL